MIIGQYFTADLRKYGYFFGLVIGTAIMTTGIYWLIYGFDQWKGEVQMASDLMTAAAVAPAVRVPLSTGIAGQFVCPQHGASGLFTYDAAGTPHCPVCGQVLLFHTASSNGVVPAAGGG